jgi:hypothetical protein
MDENLKQLIAGVNQPITPQPIPADAHFYRHVFLTQIDKKRHVPAPRCFAYVPQTTDDGLSVDCAALTTPELSLAIIGRTFKHQSTVLKNPREYAIYRIEGSFLSTLSDVPLIRHDPVFRANPPRKGEPNNPAHTVLIYKDPDDLEIRVKLQNHVQRINADQDLVAEISSLLEGMEAR